MTLVKTSNDNDEIMRSFVLGFDYDTKVDDMIYNNWSIYSRNLVGSVNLVVGQTFTTKDNLINVVKQ
jgi:hypothetical protein